MTVTEWKKVDAGLKRRIILAKTRLTESRGTLAEKLSLKAAVRQAEDAHDQHRLNYFALTKGGVK